MSMALLVINLFTGWVYTIDSGNVYHREALFYFNYILAFSGPLLDLSVIIQHRKKISPKILRSLLLFTLVPIAAGGVQALLYGLSLINISISIVSVFLYVFAYEDINDKISAAQNTEMENLKTDQVKIQNLFEQTIKAFVNAIDARVDYAEGHSVRVADYSYMLAQILISKLDGLTEILMTCLTEWGKKEKKVRIAWAFLT